MDFQYKYQLSGQRLTLKLRIAIGSIENMMEVRKEELNFDRRLRLNRAQLLCSHVIGAFFNFFCVISVSNVEEILLKI